MDTLKTTPTDEHVELQLTTEQMECLEAHAKALSYGRLVIKVMDGANLVGEIKTAAYSYHGTTCCA